jgi:hypothetical protein
MPKRREYQICPSGGSIGWRFGVDLESASDLSRRIGVSKTAEYWEKVPCTSAGPHIDLVPGRNGTGTRLTRCVLTRDSKEHAQEFSFPLASVAFPTFL